MTALGICKHCGVLTLASSAGPVHADTHNRACATEFGSGELAEPAYNTHHTERDHT